MNNNWDKYTDIRGLSIRYREAGDGPTLVLVHGIAGFLEEWEPSVNILCSKFRVIALDLPGHGLSDKPDAQYTLDFLTDFLKDFISAICPGKVYLAGHSLGGAVCLNLVIRYPHITERLILVNSVFNKIPLTFRLCSFPFFQRIRLRVPMSAVKATARRSFFKKERISAEWLELARRYINEPGAVRVMLSVLCSSISLSGLKREVTCHVVEAINRIDIPVLVLFGDKDRIIPNKNSSLLHKSIKGSKCVRIKNCGHELQYESCDVFCENVMKFLE